MLLVLVTPRAYGGVGVEWLASVPVNVSSAVEIEQGGWPDIEATSGFGSKPFDPPIVWALRIDIDEGRWAVELMHHKLFLKTPPPEVSRFSITHGFNLVTLQRGFAWGRLQGWFGGGIVVAHPEIEVRQRTLDDPGWFDAGYHPVGPVFGAALSKRWTVTTGFDVVGEVRHTLTPVEVPIPDGEASFTLGVFHFMLGVRAHR